MDAMNEFSYVLSFREREEKKEIASGKVNEQIDIRLLVDFSC